MCIRVGLFLALCMEEREEPSETAHQHLRNKLVSSNPPQIHESLLSCNCSVSHIPPFILSHYGGRLLSYLSLQSTQILNIVNSYTAYPISSQNFGYIGKSHVGDNLAYIDRQTDWRTNRGENITSQTSLTEIISKVVSKSPSL